MSLDCTWLYVAGGVDLEITTQSFSHDLIFPSPLENNFIAQYIAPYIAITSCRHLEKKNV
jgi:hypothetical protein